MNYEPFLKSVEAQDLAFAKAICATIGDDYDRIAAIYDAFYASSTKLSRDKFFKVKRIVVKLAVWLHAQSLITEEYLTAVSKISIFDIDQISCITQNYFASLDDVLDFVSTVGGFAGLDGRNDLLQLKSIIILAWHGVERSDMIELKKSELAREDRSVYIASRRQKIFLDERSFDILYRYSIIDEYKDFPCGNRSRTLKPSLYLMRSYTSPKLKRENNISVLIAKFNKFAEELNLKSNRIIAISSLHHNGVLYKMLSCNTFDMKEIERIASCDSLKGRWYVRMFKYWKKIYYPL